MADANGVRRGNLRLVRVSDFPIPGVGRATPYGVYDLGQNAGWVNVGIDHETAAFAVESIRRWWNAVGKLPSPEAKRLLISADGGGSNGSRVRLWKWERQQFADETGLAITVCHLPPGTSKWNQIEHRLFAWISQNWRGKPLTNYAVILSRDRGDHDGGRTDRPVPARHQSLPHGAQDLR